VRGTVGNREDGEANRASEEDHSGEEGHGEEDHGEEEGYRTEGLKSKRNFI